MNISKEVLELDFDKIYNNLELESKNGYDKYIKYMQLPKCITSFVMYCCDVISGRYKPFCYESKIQLGENNDLIEILNETNTTHDWTLIVFEDNTVCVEEYDLINFNKQIPEYG